MEDVVSVGDEILVKVTDIDNQGRINLSRKDAIAKKEEEKINNKNRRAYLPFYFLSSDF